MKISNPHFYKVLFAIDFANTCLVSPLQRLELQFRPLNNLSNLEKFELFIQISCLATI